MASPVVEAVSAVFGGVRDLLSDGTITIPALKIRKTYRSQAFREDLEEGVTALVYPQTVSRNRAGNSAVFDEYQVDVAVELVTRFDPMDEIRQQETMLNHCQDIADGLSRKLAVSYGLFASQDGGMFEETMIDEMAIVSVKCSGIYRVIHKVAL